MTLPEPIPAKISGESSSSPTPASLFDSFCFRGHEMKRTQRFKRVAKPSLAIPETEPDRDGMSLRSKSRRLRAKPNPKLQPQPTLDAMPASRSSSGKMEILPRDFFQIDALDLAPRLLGKYLRRDDVVLQITEVVSFSLISPFSSPTFDCDKTTPCFANS